MVVVGVAVGLEDEKTLAKRRKDGLMELEGREGVMRGEKAEEGGKEGESLMVGGVNRKREVKDMFSCSLPLIIDFFFILFLRD